jgi:hypothetical protein
VGVRQRLVDRLALGHDFFELEADHVGGHGVEAVHGNRRHLRRDVAPQPARALAAEEGDRFIEHRILLRLDEGREGVQRLQGLQLRVLVGGHEEDELPGRGLVRCAPGDDVERAAVGTGHTAGQRGRAPLACGVRGQPVLQVAGEPRAHHLGGDAPLPKAGDPLIRPGHRAGVQARQPGFAGQREGALEARRGHQHAAFAVEIQAFAFTHLGAQHDVADVGRVGQQVGAGGRLQAPAGGDEAFPAAGEVGLGQAGARHQVAAVQQGAGADVGGQADQRTVRRGGLAEGVAHEAVAQGQRVVGRLVQRLQPAAGGELGDEAEVDRHDVGQARAGGQRGRHRGVVVGVLQRAHTHLDVRVPRVPARQRGLGGAVQVGEGGDADRGLRRGAFRTGQDAGAEQRKRLAATDEGHDQAACSIRTGRSS